ncbi:vegetative cell wall protein gp1-like [Oryza brachyantha]|uniref:vegetative cell wall protein gp1-like n=1 Tax=Oryza brachyantha TaxID=4533 RepID=UPI001AD97A81|nr:vegetative cell wall protein gp1-like [Oryza brachyantha]
MERKGGCCLAPRYAGQAAMAGQMGKIMLKFRPIAPKPAAMSPAPAPAPAPAAPGAGRGKRKAVGGGGRRGRKPKKPAATAAVTAPHAPAPVPVPAAEAVPKVVGGCKEREKEKEKSFSSPSSSSSGMTSVDSSPPPPPSATLPLLPVPPMETMTTQVAGGSELPPAVAPAHSAGPSVVAPRPLLPAAALVTVEDVTSVWRDGADAPSSAARAGDEHDDDAPAFVSDQWGRVTWTNAAFHRAVAPGLSRVALAAKGAVPAWGSCAGFTCRVRVHPSSPHRRGGSLVAPCDVWRLDAAGCYLWRLDLQAALSLSLRLGGGALP